MTEVSINRFNKQLLHVNQSYWVLNDTGLTRVSFMLNLGVPLFHRVVWSNFNNINANYSRSGEKKTIFSCYIKWSLYSQNFNSKNSKLALFLGVFWCCFIYIYSVELSSFQHRNYISQAQRKIPWKIALNFRQNAIKLIWTKCVYSYVCRHHFHAHKMPQKWSKFFFMIAWRRHACALGVMFTNHARHSILHCHTLFKWNVYFN